MKIAVHADGPTIRGNERQVLRVARGLADRGHELVISCRAGSPTEASFRDAGLRTTGIRPGGDADLYNALRFTRWLRREAPDAALLTSWNRAFVAAACARLAGVPRVVLRLGAVQEIRPYRGALERLAMERWYHAILVNSEGVREQVLRAAPRLTADRVPVVHNAVSIVRAAPAPVRAELGLPAGAVLALSIGAWEPRKGFADLIDAAPALPPHLHLVLVGGGDPARGAALRERAAALGVAERVHLVGHRGDIPALLAAAELVVLPSRSEGLSVAMLEAMSMRKPIVATDIAGVQDAMGPRPDRPAAGWIVPPRDAAALADAVTRAAAALGTPEAEARGAEAGWRVETWFNDERMLRGYEAVLAGEAP